MENFEKLFSQFIDGEDYDKAEDYLFTIIRTAFTAGYNAGVHKDEKDKIVEIDFGNN